MANTRSGHQRWQLGSNLYARKAKLNRADTINEELSSTGIHMNLIKIDHPSCRATLSLFGGQLLDWQPKDQTHPVLWCTPNELWISGKPIRGGIPICWPWFGRVKSPAHGFARTSHWTLVNHADRGDHVEITLLLQDSQDTREIWPHAFILTLTLKLGNTCEVMLNIDCEHASTGALHSYFQVGDSFKASVSNTGKFYKTSPESELLEQHNNNLFTPVNVDRIYPQAQEFTQIEDPVLHRRINLTHTKMHDLVVWNPGSSGTKILTDMFDQDYQFMLCVETASITQPLSNQIGVEISVTSSSNGTNL